MIFNFISDIKHKYIFKDYLNFFHKQLFLPENKPALDYLEIS